MPAGRPAYISIRQRAAVVSVDLYVALTGRCRRVTACVPDGSCAVSHPVNLTTRRHHRTDYKRCFATLCTCDRVSTQTVIIPDTVTAVGLPNKLRPFCKHAAVSYSYIIHCVVV